MLPNPTSIDVVVGRNLSTSSSISKARAILLSLGVVDMGDRCVVGDTFPSSISSSTFWGVLSNSFVDDGNDVEAVVAVEEEEEEEEEEEDAVSSLSPLAVRTLSLAPLLQSSSSPSMAAVCTVALTPFATAATAAA